MDEIIIYKYENKINHHIYIGQTVNLSKRIREHRCAANNENSPDHNFPIHLALAKYGEDAFNIDIIEKCSQDNVDERERYWVAFYDSYKNGYNATPGGQDGGGYNGKTVLAFDLKGNYVCSYENAKVCAKELNAGYGFIQQVLHQIRPTAKGLQLKYEDDPREIGEFKSRQGGKIPIWQMDDDWNILNEFESAYDAARQCNLDASTITKVCKGKLQHHGGFRWGYANDC